jgi:hypothetical protein
MEDIEAHLKRIEAHLARIERYGNGWLFIMFMMLLAHLNGWKLW